MGFVVSWLENPCQRGFWHARGRSKGWGVGRSRHGGRPSRAVVVRYRLWRTATAQETAGTVESAPLW